MPVYASYLRVSSEEQKERQSIKSQLEAINAYARANNIKIKYTFADDGISGSVPVPKRPEGSRLLEKADDGAFDTLLVFRMDRISRDALEMLKTFKRLEDKGVSIRSITEPFETSDPVGKMVITMLGGMAQLEKDALKERSIAGMRRGANDGRWMGGRAPFGYRVEDRRLVVCEEEASIVRELFDGYLHGETTLSLANLMNARDVPVPAAWRGLKQGEGARWTDATVHKILRNEAYTGSHKWNKRKTLVTDGARVTTSLKDNKDQISINAEPIISQKDFDTVQRRLRENLRFSPRNSHREYILRGLVQCGDCGLNCFGCGGNWPFYSCKWSTRRAGTTCNRARIPAKELEESVWNDLVEIAKKPDALLKAIKKEHSERHKLTNVKGRQEEIALAIEKKTAERGKVLSLLRKDVISEEEAEAQLREIERDREALENESDRLKGKLRNAERVERFMSNMNDALSTIRKNAKRADERQRGEMIRQVIKKVVVSSPANGEADLDVRIEYLLPDS